MPDSCPACEGRGLVRMRWNETWSSLRTGIRHSIGRYRDEWCRRCNGKGVIKQQALAEK